KTTHYLKDNAAKKHSLLQNSHPMAPLLSFVIVSNVAVFSLLKVVIVPILSTLVNVKNFFEI
ncbi:hypothetical protein, partial [uncultured Helicobacter sp.]|uniref:hypothetical protein n=1 Tax=uncultured Helicobacter sp. TaxID=175537 RepID=UPI00262042AB